MKPRVIVGTLLTFAGMAFFAAGGVVLSSGIDRQRIQDAQLKQSETSCREQLVRLGRLTPLTNNVYEVEVSDVRDPRKALADASAALAMCPGRDLTESCLGVNCTANGVPGPMRLVFRLAPLGDVK